MKSRRITKKMRESILQDMRRKGGKNSRKNLTDEQKTELARKAAWARWDKQRAGIAENGAKQKGKK